MAVLASACKLGLEGDVAKRRTSTYRSSRSADWVKLKCSQRQEFVIGGYTAPQGARTGFVDLTDLRAKSLAKRQPGCSAKVGTRNSTVNPKKPAKTKSTA